MDQNDEMNNQKIQGGVGDQNTPEVSNQSIGSTKVAPVIGSPQTSAPTGNQPPPIPIPNQIPPAHKLNLPTRFQYLVAAIAVIVVITALYAFLGHSLTGSSPNFTGHYNSSLNTGNTVTAFRETGLPNGTRWTMSYASNGESSTNNTIIFRTAAGLYFFSVIPVDLSQYNPGNGTVNCFRGMYPKPSSGYLNASAVQTVIFSNTTFCGT